MLLGSITSTLARNVTDIHGDGREKVSSQQSRDVEYGRKSKGGAGDENSEGEGENELSKHSNGISLEG